jgi:hypothetical protein
MNSIKTIASVAFSAAALALLAAPASAGSIPVANFSFETLPPGGFNVNCGAGCNYTYGLTIPGWNTTGTVGQSSLLPSMLSAYDGSVYAYSGDSGSIGTISQTVGTAALGTYTLSVFVGDRLDFPNDPGIVDLIIGSHVIQATGAPLVPGTWTDYTASFTTTGADIGQSITISLSTPLDGSRQSLFDDVQLSTTAATPLPSTWLMMLGGFLGLGFFAYRGTKKNATAVAAA